MPWSRRWLRLFLALALAVAVAAGSSSVAVAQSAEERRIGETRATIEQIREALAGAEADRDRKAASLRKAKRRLKAVDDAVGAAERAVRRQQRAVERAREELALAEAREREQRELMGQRAVALFKQGRGAPMSSVLASDTPAEALERSAMVDLVTRVDRRTFEEYHSARVAVAGQRERFEEEKVILARVLDQQRELLADVQQIRDRRAVVLAASADRVEDLRAQEQHLERESRHLAALARRSTSLPPSRSGASSAAGRAAGAPAASGGWTFPASGPITSTFGPRWGRMHEGIDIGAPTGTPIYAARTGTVSYAGGMSGYGNLVLVDHGRGVVTAYAHQSRILASVGQRVAGGQQIGEVGSTGNSTGPHLHFEVRVNGAPQNPLAYLN